MSQKSLKLEILEKLMTLITSGFGLVAALAWNDAIQSLFNEIFGKQNSIFAKFGYALVITILIVIITVKFGSLVNKLKGEKGPEEADKF